MLVDALRQNDKKGLFESNDDFVNYSTGLLPLDYANGFWMTQVDPDTGEVMKEPIPGILGGKFILLFGIKMGLFTPSEVGAFACVYAFCVGRFAYKELNKENFILALKDSVADIGAVMFIIAFSAILGYGVPIDRVPQAVTGFIVGISTNPTVILLLLVALLVFIGMFMEGAATILILTPVFMPMIQSLGIDPVLFGLIFCTVVTLGNCTPPVGLSMFTVNSILDCSLQEYCKEMVIWLITFLLSVVIIILVPGPFMYLQEAFF